ncbi:hypothetical protein B0A48_07658 [Cryoendolithus antarcticus]|uniref:NmrA-like domain-containing protein n=1 Tax=Cryoendolithus antarcticus TaxID=1507870 RepID=A0A1V8T746_9PEZI|nr:hypothetical protein B0A48_07658 [Cryoendolithus antarcticus]
MSGKITSVAIAGAAGSLGAPVLEELLAAGFEVTVLTRKSSPSTFPSSAKVVTVDYDSVESLRKALHGQDALISTITTTAIEQQFKLLDAALAEGVIRVIPSEFGSDTTQPDNRKLPVYGDKVKIQEYLQEKTRGTKTSYTFVINNVFIDWGIGYNFLLNSKKKEISLYDGGEVEYPATSLRSVAKGVVGVLKYPEETKNRFVKIDGIVLTQRKLLEIAKKAIGPDGWTVSEPTTSEVEAQGYEVLKNDPGNVMGWVVPLLVKAIFSAERKSKLTDTDNDLLGVPKNTEEEIATWIKEAAAK